MNEDYKKDYHSTRYILRSLRRITHCPEGESILLHTQDIVHQLEIKKGDKNIERIKKEKSYLRAFIDNQKGKFFMDFFSNKFE